MRKSNYIAFFPNFRAENKEDLKWIATEKVFLIKNNHVVITQ